MSVKPAPTLIFVAAAVLMAHGAPAMAAPDEPIASARKVDSADATDAQIRQYLDDASTAPPTVAGPAPISPVSDGQPHGEVGVGIGTGGYRHAHASTVVPVGEVGTAAIAVSDTRFNGRFGPRKQQSLSVAVNLGDAAKNPAAPACVRAPSTRGPEPLWVTRMRAEQATSAGLACVPR